MKELGIRNKN